MPFNKYDYYTSLEQRYGLPEGYLARTEILESGGGKMLYNKDTKAAGPFQIMPKTQKYLGVKDPYNVEESAEATARLAAQNRTSLQNRGIENPTAADLYGAHQQGAAGYANLVKAGDQPASKIVGKQAVALNGGDPNMPASQFANKITSKYSGVEEQGPPQPLPAPVEEQGPPQPPPLSTQDTLDTLNARRSDSGLKELGFLHNYFKSLDTSATGVRPLAVPDLFHQPTYRAGGIVGLK